jgi:hypothetical protein
MSCMCPLIFSPGDDIAWMCLHNACGRFCKTFHPNFCSGFLVGQLNKLIKNVLHDLQALILPYVCYLSIKNGAIPLWEVTN